MSSKALLYRGTKITLKKTNFKVVTSFTLNLTKGGNRNYKYMSPDADVLPVLKDLCPFEFSDGSVVTQRSYPVSAYLIGILRALLVLKAKKPDLYREIVETAKYLSFEHSPEVEIPVGIALTQGLKTVDSAFIKVNSLTGISKEKYLRCVITSLAETGLLSKVAVFSQSPEKDKEECENFLGEEVKEKNLPSPVVEMNEELKKTLANLLFEELKKIREALSITEEF